MTEFRIIIKRSRQGTYHAGHSMTDHVNCNTRLRATPAWLNEVERAGAHMFCEKCFPNGKPNVDHYFGKPNA